MIGKSKKNCINVDLTKRQGKLPVTAVKVFLHGELAEITKTEENKEKVTISLKTKSASGFLHMYNGKEIEFGIEASSKKEINKVGISISLPEDAQFHIPGKSILLDKDMPVGEEWNGGFPWGLSAQFVMVNISGSWIRIGTKTKKLYFPSVQILREEHGFTLKWEMQPKAPFPKEYNAPNVSLDVFNSLDEGIDDYKKWMEGVFNLKKKEDNSDVPKWARKTRLVLVIDMWRATGEIAHDYQDVIDMVGELKKIGVPEETVINPWGWYGRLNSIIPEYWPVKELGGIGKFREMIETIHRYGFRIMPDMNLFGFNRNHPDFAKFKKYQATGPSGQKAGWIGVTPTGGFGFPFSHIRPCAKKWREYLIKKIEKVVKEFNLDAIFLDQSCNIINDLQCNFENGIKTLLNEIRKRLPDVLIGGESINERVASVTPFCQFWGPPWVGLEEILYEKDSPINTLLYDDYAYFFAHLGIPAAVPARYIWTNYPFIVKYGIKNAFKMGQSHGDKHNVIKTLRINYKDYGIDSDSEKEIKELQNQAIREEK